MYKVIWLCRFKEGMDPEDAKRHWHDVHGQLALKVPGLLGYVQSYRVGELRGLGAEDPARSFDGYSVGYFESSAAYQAARATPEWDALGADAANVFDRQAMLEAGLEERVIRPVPRP